MSADTEQRKLAAIVFTDMVGYSALAQRDDKLALELLEEHRRLLREIFPRFNGTEIKTIGDAFLIEFNSALEAAQCAIEIQRTLAKRNHDVTLDRRIELKIGICVSMDVERQIRNALEARFEKLAPTELKNISVPMDLFRIVLPWERQAPPVAKSGIRSERWPSSDESRIGKSHVTPAASKWVWIGAIALAVIGFGWWWSDRQSGKATKPVTRSNTLSTSAAANQKSIAVLPFVDLSEARDQEYFCDGISEEILDALAKTEGLRVVARTSSFSFKGKNADASEIAQKLNVQNVLEGSLRREGNRIRITAELIDARDGFDVWSETFERELQGVFAVQDEITRSIVDALKIKLAVAPSSRPRPNIEAYDLYLQGLYCSNKSDEENLRKSLTLFQRALDKDANFARAWTGIAKAWYWLADVYVRPLEAYPKMLEAASKAVAMDERDAEAHCYLGEAKRILERNLAGEEAELKRALELDPNSATAHLIMSLFQSAQGKLKEAVNEIQKAKELDPLSPAISYFAVGRYLATDQIDEAIAEGQRTLQLDTTFQYLTPPLAEAYLATGKFEEAVVLYEKAQEVTHFPSSGMAIAYARMGRPADARRILDQLLAKARTQYYPGDSIAAIYVALGDKDEAFSWLEHAFEEHSYPMYTFLFSREFRPLYSDPRFPGLLRRIGVDPDKVLNRQKNQ